MSGEGRQHDRQKEGSKPLHRKGGRGKRHQAKGRSGGSTTTQKSRRPSSTTQWRRRDRHSTELNFVCEHCSDFKLIFILSSSGSHAQYSLSSVQCSRKGLALCPRCHPTWASEGTLVGPGKDTHGTPAPTQCEGRGWPDMQINQQ